MKCKTFEVLDRMTFIPVLAVKLEPGCEADRYLLSRSGYGRSPEDQSAYVQVSKIYGGRGESHCDPFDWGSNTMTTAHQHIIANFDGLESGAVVDVEFVLGLTKEPKRSEAAQDTFGAEGK